MDKRYKVIVWGPGNVGGTVLAECLRRPEFEVVGVRVWSEGKDGVDIGTLAGVDPAGVAATSDSEALIALDADCVVHTPIPELDETAMTADVIRLLGSGKNVISAQSFFNPNARGRDVAERLEQACKEGGSTLIGTGLHPSFMVERLVMTLSGLVNNLSHIRFVEQIDCAKLLEANPMARMFVGWGAELDELGEHWTHAQIAMRHYRDVVCHVGQRLFGVEPEEVRVEFVCRGIPAKRRLTFGEVTIEPGQAMTIVYEMRGYVGAHHFYTGEEYWFLGEENRVIGGFEGSPNYLAEISGSAANLRMHLDVESLVSAEPVTNHLTAAPLVQAILPVCEAKQGFLAIEPPAHYAADLRTLALRPGQLNCAEGSR